MQQFVQRVNPLVVSLESPRYPLDNAAAAL